MLNTNQNTNSFSMRKIPVTSTKEQLNSSNNESLDKIKILELSNVIDRWEQEILFSANGFFSVKGKEVKDRLKEFEIELDGFISSKISEMKFEDEKFKEIAIKIKSDKISAIKHEMRLYEKQQLSEWEMDVYEQAIISSINRAVLYKSNPLIVSSSFKNGLDILKLMAEKENWSDKVNKHKIDSYKSDFYTALINEFIKNKDINAYIYFEKYKDNLIVEDKEKLESSIKEFKTNVIAYNWAKEVHSYNLSEKEQNSKLNEIEDKEIEAQARVLLSLFSFDEKKKREEEEKQMNQKNWQEIIKVLEKEEDKAYLYIDYATKKESINAKKQYIKQINKNGYISTNIEKFIALMSEFLKHFEEFKVKDISNYQHCFSKQDYDFFVKLQSLSNPEYENICFDCIFLYEKIEEKNIKKQQYIYECIKLLFSSKEECKKINKKEADLKARNEIIDLIISRLKEKEEEKEGDKQ